MRIFYFFGIGKKDQFMTQPAFSIPEDLNSWPDQTPQWKDPVQVRIKNQMIVQTPNLIMIWLKAVAGLNTWCRFCFDRRSIESYYMITFVYQIYELIANSLIFACQPSYFGGYAVPLIGITLLIGFLTTYTLHSFLHFLERVEYQH